MKILKFILIVAIITLPILGFAQLGYEPLVPLPGQPAGNSTVDLGGYLSNMYKLLIAIAIILAVVMVTYAGLEYMGTDSVFGKTDARGKIGNAIGGVVLALLSYLILFTINPAIVGVGGFGFLNRRPVPPPSAGTLTITTNDLTLEQGVSLRGVVIGITKGQPPYTSTITNGPTGVTINDNVLYGSPVTFGTHIATISITDANGKTATKDITINVVPQTPKIFSPINKNIEAGTEMSRIFIPIISGGPVQSATLSGSVPPGIFASVVNEGFQQFVELGGRINTPNTYSFIVRVTNVSGATADSAITFNVYTPAPQNNTTTQFCYSHVDSNGVIEPAFTYCFFTSTECETARVAKASSGTQQVETSCRIIVQ